MVKGTLNGLGRNLWPGHIHDTRAHSRGRGTFTGQRHTQVSGAQSLARGTSRGKSTPAWKGHSHRSGKRPRTMGIISVGSTLNQGTAQGHTLTRSTLQRSGARPKGKDTPTGQGHTMIRGTPQGSGRTRARGTSQGSGAHPHVRGTISGQEHTHIQGLGPGAHSLVRDELWSGAHIRVRDTWLSVGSTLNQGTAQGHTLTRITQ